jgi:hypothetical protein
MYFAPFPNPIQSAARATALFSCLLLAACIYVPRTRIAEDPQCQGVQKSMVIEAQKIESLQGCNHSTCVGVLVSAGVVAAASLVVSGSIAVVGNVVYWVEREGKCLRNQSQDSQP